MQPKDRIHCFVVPIDFCPHRSCHFILCILILGGWGGGGGQGRGNKYGGYSAMDNHPIQRGTETEMSHDRVLAKWNVQTFFVICVGLINLGFSVPVKNNKELLLLKN